jgi:peptide/nickel transport system permease protein
MGHTEEDNPEVMPGPQAPGPTTAAEAALADEVARLRQENEELRARLQQAEATVEGQGRLLRVRARSTEDSFGEALQPPGVFSGLLRYALRRGAVIALTIFLGIYLTVTVANRDGIVDDKIRQSEVESPFMSLLWSDEGHGPIAELRWNLEEQAGLHLPVAVRNLRWTVKALFFDWGKADYRLSTFFFTRYQDYHDVSELLLNHFPNTLLLFGAADLLIFLFGIPLALYLATRRQGQWLDRVITMVAPLSSIPSWVHGILLVSIFALGLRILPPGGKYDMLPPETTIGYVAIVAKHMILPVLAILLGTLFQLVYSWRTYFLIYAEEDYVDLALAKGLAPRIVERRYVLRPAMPYVLTSFALTLVGFWQMATALEYFFNWPGMGLLYVNSLPNFWGEQFFPGEMGVVLSIVTIFAILLGFVVFALDIAYAWLDPRVRQGNGREKLRRVRKFRWRLRLRPRERPAPASAFALAQSPVARKRDSLRDRARGLALRLAGLKTVWTEIRRYPSAMVGLSLIALMVGGSLLVAVALPYGQIGATWHTASLTGKMYAPKSVPPVWSNLFRSRDWPETIVLRSQDGTLQRTSRIGDNGTDEISFTATFEYPYQFFPQDVQLYIDATYQEKRPHVLITWVTPDGRELQPKSPAISPETIYSFSEHITVRRYVQRNEHWQNWVVLEGVKQTPGFQLLFADPEADEPRALPGTYMLKITTLTFEPDTDLDVEFVLFGKVYGWAGTDHLRRDLVVPLLWGLPFTLAFGVLGAVVTTVLAMILAAAAAWYGGWIDTLIQRLTEANMILPVLAVGILLFGLYGVNLWVIIGAIILLNIFGSPTKAFRAAFLQVKQAPYVEAARAYGASDSRLIFRYLVPRIIPVFIPQLVTLIPSLVFLEATLAIFNVFDPRYPTWGRVIYEAITQGALFGGSQYWVLEPISLLLLTGLAFALLGFALERILNPRLRDL